MPVMAKNKKVSGKHAAPRTAVQLPEPWVAVARQLATGRPMPLTWWMVDMIRKEAEANGVTDLPPLPWEKDE